MFARYGAYEFYTLAASEEPNEAVVGTDLLAGL